MGIGSDLTVLFGIEAYQKGWEVIDDLNEKLDHLKTNFGETGDTANDMSGKLDEAFSGSDQAAMVLSGRIDGVKVATDRANEALESMTGLVQKAADGDEGAMEAAAGATDVYTNAVRRLIVANEEAAGAARNVAKAAEGTAATGVALDGTTSRAGKATSALNTVGKAGALTFAAVAVAGYIAVKAASSYDKYTVAIANNAGISEASAKKITDSFLSMSDNSTFSASEIAQAYGTVAGQLGFVEGKALTTSQAHKFMGQAMTIAAASGQSLTSVVTGLSTVVQAYKLPLDKVNTATTSLYNGATITGQQIGSFSTQIGRAKSQLGVLAPSIQTTVSLIADLANHGETGRLAISTMNEMFTKLLETGKASTPTFTEVNNAINKLPKSLQGTAREFANGKISITQFQDVLKNVGTLSLPDDQYLKSFETLDTQAKESESTLNALKTTPVQEQLAKMGVSVFNAGGKFVGIKSIITQLGPKFDAMKTTQERLTVANLLFGTSARKVLDTIMAGKKGWDSATTAVENHKNMMTAAKNANTTFDANMEHLSHTVDNLKIVLGNDLLPIVTVVAQHVTSIVKTIADWIEHNKGVVEVIAVVVGSLSGLAGALWLGSKAVHGLMGAWKSLKAVWDGITSVVSKVIGSNSEVDASNDEMSGDLEANSAAMSSAVESAATAIQTAADQIMAALEQIGTASTELDATFDANMEGMGASAEAMAGVTDEAALDVDAAVGSTGIGLILIGLAAAVLLLSKHWKVIWDGIKDVAEDVWKYLKDGFDAVKNTLTSIWDDLSGTAKTVFKIIAIAILLPMAPIVVLIGAIYELAKHWKEVWSDIVGFFKTVGSDIVTGIKTIISYYIKLPAEIMNAVSSLAGKMNTWGLKIMQSAWNGIVAGAKAIWTFWEQLPSKVVGFIDGLLLDMYNFGKTIISRLISGITDAAKGVGNIVLDALKKIPGMGIVLGTVSAVGHAASSALHGVESLFHHSGGVIQGPMGTDVPAILQAGELVLTRQQQSNVAAGLLSKSSGNGAGGNVTVHVHVNGQVYGSLAQFQRDLGTHLTTKLLPQAGVNLPH
jgi:hypothetical protein